MSETPRTDEAELREYHSNPEAPKVVYADFARMMERDRNRWRSVAEQLERRFRLHVKGKGCIDSARLDSHLKEDEEALAAFDSLRKEQL